MWTSFWQTTPQSFHRSCSAAETLERQEPFVSTAHWPINLSACWRTCFRNGMIEHHGGFYELGDRPHHTVENRPRDVVPHSEAQEWQRCGYQQAFSWQSNRFVGRKPLTKTFAPVSLGIVLLHLGRLPVSICFFVTMQTQDRAHSWVVEGNIRVR